MNKTKNELINWCNSKLGTPYVYGAKGKVLTQAQINAWASMYPSTFTPSYIAKSKTFLGRTCTDCSGLISWLTGVLRGSSQYKGTATKVVSIKDLNESMIGWALWKSGHIGIYTGGGYCIEAKGINYGTVRTKVSSTGWTHVLKLCDIDYQDITVPTKQNNGWNHDGTGWKYFINGIQSNGWKMIENVWYYFKNNGYSATSEWIMDNGCWYYMNANGSLYYGWLMYNDKWCYLNKDGSPEGAMVTGFQKIQYDGKINDYFFDKNGYMVTNELTIIPDENGSLQVKGK